MKADKFQEKAINVNVTLTVSPPNNLAQLLFLLQLQPLRCPHSSEEDICRNFNSFFLLYAQI